MVVFLCSCNANTYSRSLIEGMIENSVDAELVAEFI